LEVRSGFEPL